MDNYLYLNNHSLSPELCNKIIELFNKDSDKYNGITASGHNTSIKTTLDLNLLTSKMPEWKKICNILNNELTINTKTYIENINNHINTHHEKEDTTNDYNLFAHKFLKNDTFQMQKYEKGKGRYIYHDDHSYNHEKNEYRVITFLWYLNTVDEGGETELWCTHKIKPEVGKLLLFPACWTFPHRGKMPVSDDKYIITGWLYLPNSK
jgi:hypothetical protein